MHAHASLLFKYQAEKFLTGPRSYILLQETRIRRY